MIHRFPNGATRRVERPVTSYEGPTQGTETSKYLQEEKSIEIPQVAASERGLAQTGLLRRFGVVGPVWGIVPHAVWPGVEATWNGPSQKVKAL